MTTTETIFIIYLPSAFIFCWLFLKAIDYYMETKTARVLQEHTVNEMADIIFLHFEVMQSCAVRGYVTIDGRLHEKGKAVLERLEWLDTLNNTNEGKRYRNKPKNSVGGYIAHKIFKYTRVISNDEAKYTIWRWQ